VTSLPPIDRDTALRLLEKQVRLAGFDHVYEAHDNVCQYVDGGQPDCLIARALHDYGVPVAVMAEWDTPNQEIRQAWQVFNPGFLTLAAVKVFEVAQNKQDAGQSWGRAVIAARNAMNMGLA